MVSEQSGTVLVRLPGSSRFEPLDAAQGIPVGSTVDARKGVVVLTSIPKAGGTPETAQVLGRHLPRHAVAAGSPR